MTIALIDGDIVAHRAAAGQQKTVIWEAGEEPMIIANVAASREAAFQTIEAWMLLAKCNQAIVTFTGTHNFRKRVLPTYKAHRKGAKPFAFADTVKAVSDRWATRRVDGLEADDLMGIMATSDKYRDAVVVTIDKDLRGVPGRHLNPIRDQAPVVVTEAEADYTWLTQVLTGDATDGYSGLPKCGPVKAAKLLHGKASVDAMWRAIVGAYKVGGLTETDALAMARVARILRREDYDKTTKEILLWHPTTPIRIPLLDSCGEPRPSTSANAPVLATQSSGPTTTPDSPSSH